MSSASNPVSTESKNKESSSNLNATNQNNVNSDATSHPSLAAWQRLFNSYQHSTSHQISTSTQQRQQTQSPNTQTRRQKSNNFLLGPTSTSTSASIQSKDSKPVKTDAEHEHAIKRIRSRVLTEGIPDDNVSISSSKGGKR